MEGKRQKTSHVFLEKEDERVKPFRIDQEDDKDLITVDNKKKTININGTKDGSSKNKVINLKSGKDKKVFIYKHRIWKLTRITKYTWSKITKQSRCLDDLRSEPFVANYTSVDKIDIQGSKGKESVVVQEFDCISGFDLTKYKKLCQLWENREWNKIWIQKSLSYVRSKIESQSQGDDYIADEQVRLSTESGIEKIKSKLLLCLMITVQMQSIWSKGWSHGDIKPGNIMISPASFQTFWIDFELCRSFTDPPSQRTSFFQGSIAWVPPSVLISLDKQIEWTPLLCKKKDMWGLVATMYWILTGCYIFPCTKETDAEYIEKVKKATDATLSTTGSPIVDDALNKLFTAIQEATQESEMDSLMYRTRSFLQQLCL